MKIYITLALLALTAGAGCSSQQVYDSAAGWRQQECSKIIDPDQRQQCFEAADMPHSEYEKQQSTQ